MTAATRCWLLAVGCSIAATAGAQESPRADSAVSSAVSDTVAPKSAKLPKLFSSDTVVRITLTTNFRAIRRSRAGTRRYHPATISYADTGGTTVTLPLRARVRGHWRRANCAMLPVLLNFWPDSSKKTLFARLDRGRLVTHCRDEDAHEQHVLQEYQLYRVYNLLTPFSHRARLVHATYVDSATGQPFTARHAFILEDDDDMAERNGGKQLEQQGARSGDLDPYTDALVGVFQYLIGGTDWSVAALHNIQLVSVPAEPIRAVAYDFDWSGAVNAGYARPDYRLPIRTVRERLFRGYCAPRAEFQRVFALFREKKPAIYALYADHIGGLMKPDVARRTLEYFDQFYAVIDDERRAADLIRGCRESQ